MRNMSFIMCLFSEALNIFWKVKVLIYIKNRIDNTVIVCIALRYVLFFFF